MRDRLVVAGNWKMNLSRDEAVTLSRAVAGEVSSHQHVDVALFPPFPWLVPVKEALSSSPVRLGAQNCHTESSGAYTGEVSATMLAPLCDAVLAGHSERRHLFAESDALVGNKVQAIIANGMQAYLCVGETLEEREAGQAEAVVAAQLTAGLAEFPGERLDDLVVAYEPVWAIGTGVAATAGDAQEMAAYVRSWLTGRFGQSGATVPILYGGSINPENAAELFGQPDIDGGLVGGSSLKQEAFNSIIRSAAELESV